MSLKAKFFTMPILFVLIVATHTTLGQTTGFTYQGSLRESGGSANGQYDFQFKLFDAPTAPKSV